MEDNKNTSEFEKLVKEATGEIPVVNNEEVKEDSNQINQEVSIKNKTQDVVKPEEKTIPVIEEAKTIEMPQTKDNNKSSIPANVNTNTSDSQIIGTIKPDKQKSPIAMLVLFGALILFIVFMPTAISLFNKYFGTNLNVDSLNNVQRKTDDTTTKTNNNNDNNQKQEIKMYDLKEDTVIQIDKIDIGGFKKNNINGYNISFYIKNNGSVLYKFDKKVYLEYYDNSNTFVGRSYLESVKEITGGISNNYNTEITESIFSNATKIEVVQRTDDDYPNVNLTNNLLTCTNQTDNIVYTFDSSSKLINIKDMYTYVKDDDLMKYNNDLITNKTKVSNLDKIDGVSSVLTETDEGFIATTVIDYQYADYSRLPSNSNYYAKDTYAKTISFEMNAKGYTCR